jgi:hypothetical protein
MFSRPVQNFCELVLYWSNSSLLLEKALPLHFHWICENPLVLARGSNPGWIIFVHLPFVGIPVRVESKLYEISASVRSQQQHHEIFPQQPAKHCWPWPYTMNSNAESLPPYPQHPPLMVRLQKQYLHRLIVVYLDRLLTTSF